MNSFNVLYAIPLSLILGAPVSAQSQYYPPNYYGGGGVNSPVVVPPTVINNAPPKTYMENESKKSC